METQSRLLFVLAAVLLALVALIMLVDPPADDQVDDGDGHHWIALLPDRDPAGVQGLTIDLGEERRVFVRQDSGWRIKEPLDASADADAVDALVDRFTSAEVDEAPLSGGLAEYGLDDPVAVVTLDFNDGGSATVTIGRDAPTGGHTYVLVGEDGPALATRRSLSAGLDDELADYRDRRIWSLAWDAVDFIRLDGPRAIVELRHHDDAWWVRAALAGPGDPPPTLAVEERRAAGPLVDRAIASLRRMRVDRFADDVQELDDDDLPWRIEVRSAGVTHALRLAEEEDGWLVRAPAQEGPVRLQAGWEEDWLLPVPQWWAKDLEQAVGSGEGPSAAGDDAGSGASDPLDSSAIPPEPAAAGATP